MTQLLGNLNVKVCIALTHFNAYFLLLHGDRHCVSGRPLPLTPTSALNNGTSPVMVLSPMVAKHTVDSTFAVKFASNPLLLQMQAVQ